MFGLKARIRFDRFGLKMKNNFTERQEVNFSKNPKTFQAHFSNSFYIDSRSPMGSSFLCKLAQCVS